MYVSVNRYSFFTALFSVGYNGSANLHLQHILRQLLQKLYTLIKDFFDFLAFKTLRNNKKLNGVLMPLIKKCWFVVRPNIFSITKTSLCNFKRLVHCNGCLKNINGCVKFCHVNSLSSCRNQRANERSSC